ncbi:peptidase domain-containing ABC transporter [Tenacibaculum finnmarkense]|uniref:ATP-binding cassette domain-containing protein n=1 Tax=Tenacibaculum finnmarkense genomovar finnmarkense TaxID=1458503 RepID=A0AAP1WGQ5_9FLAO|nr:ATP-binding cassette domain-containing protein [Tenacibaculum finnmarkense]MBE7653302.1 ATP-binding cassette domain-containing protein [Tenacibaculum finnmarkense genomovar finnmarkense]MBE7693576.1 ATP-binding cassette domain-containing protein [Tenacibaculum finnmarkense genomovar finnmarkense]MBE7695603.1 ATP-binding cassette domain-containing protein [Tenacibaculum finnmarkense genomovar finnmarkense]MCD8403682.1 ATP-binding cassette domain-containing protein [Tenacibaculum finnmarkense 
MAENNPLTPWKRFLGLLKLEKKDILQISYYAIFEGIVALSLPLGIQAIINLLQGAQISASWVVLVILVTGGVAFSGVLKLMQIRIIETIQQRIFTRASLELSYRFPKIKMSELRNYYPPELANRFFDTLTIQKGISKILIDVPSAFLQIIFALLLLSFYHTFFILFGLLLLLLIYIVFKYTAKIGLETSLKESKNKYKVAHWLQEIARTIISFKVAGKTTLSLDKSDDLVSDYLKSRDSHFKILIIQYIQMISFKVIVTAGLLLMGGFLVLNQQMNIGQFVAAEIIILLIISSVEKLILGLESFYDVLTSIEKLGQIIDKPIENQQGSTVSDTKAFKIEIQNISYTIFKGERLILKDISFHIEPNDRILIQGESGAGKSSLIQLIAGITTPTAGNIFVNDLSIKSLQINNYRAYLGMSLSEENPFEGSIRENVTFGNTAISDDEIYTVFEIVGLTDFLKYQENGLETQLKPEGKHIGYTISKKIILARAIIKKPKLLILEDPLDQFEKKEAKKIIDFITSPSQKWSLIIVSSNDKWEEKCTKKITLHKGKIINK